MNQFITVLETMNKSLDKYLENGSVKQCLESQKIYDFFNFDMMNRSWIEQLKE